MGAGRRGTEESLKGAAPVPAEAGLEERPGSVGKTQAGSRGSPTGRAAKFRIIS